MSDQPAVLIDEFKLSTPKTKTLNEIIANKLGLTNVLIVDAANESLERSGANLPHVRILRAEGLNVYDIVKHDWLVMTKNAVQAVTTRLDPSVK